MRKATYFIKHYLKEEKRREEKRKGGEKRGKEEKNEERRKRRKGVNFFFLIFINIYLVDIYDDSSKTWSTTALSTARSDLASASSGNFVFFAGGLVDNGIILLVIC
jgi:hypothetical protein